MQHATAHLGAKRAGVFLLTNVEDDLGDLGLLHVIGDVQLAAKRLDLGKIHPVKAHIDGEGDELELFGVKIAQAREPREERERVLAP